MQSLIFPVIVSVIATLLLGQMSRRAQINGQVNRAWAMRAATAAAAILAVNGLARLLGLAVDSVQPIIAAVAFGCMAVAGFFLVRAALKGEAVQLQIAAQQQAEEFKKAQEQRNARHDK
jgi:ABC-type nickel/cobalt efflux system permease component RcnA